MPVTNKPTPLYLSDIKNATKVADLVGISLDELEAYVGRFKPDHWRFANQLKGYALLYDLRIELRHHFTKKLIVTFDL